ncbi:uncharacterized protein LOC128628554 [Artibeus jamaicensis]|uniref:uncharacterized protein LOC128628554 n=1 Tax=Artibeus jamaicensis TaxID=9417 RepID=UPI00235A4B00|nr:uncharacterized protein LOC128628554 [Artibeus jamaicensis]
MPGPCREPSFVNGVDAKPPLRRVGLGATRPRAPCSHLTLLEHRPPRPHTFFTPSSPGFPRPPGPAVLWCLFPQNSNKELSHPVQEPLLSSNQFSISFSSAPRGHSGKTCFSSSETGLHRQGCPGRRPQSRPRQNVASSHTQSPPTSTFWVPERPPPPWGTRGPIWPEDSRTALRTAEQTSGRHQAVRQSGGDPRRTAAPWRPSPASPRACRA